MASTDATAVPVKNQAYRLTFPILDADGDLVTGATGLDSEVSKDAGTFADCTNEATEIATSSGVYYLDLTATEMNADTVAVIVKTSSSGAKTTAIVLYPQEADDIKVSVTHFGGTAGTFASGRPEVNTTHAAGTAWGSGAITAGVIAADAIGASELAADAVAEIADGVWDEARSGHVTDGTFGQAFQVIDSGTAQGGGTNSITLRAAYSSADDRINGALVFILSGTGAGQGNVINDYNNTTKVATCDNNWATNPDNTSVYILYPGSAGATTTAVAGAVWNAARASYTTAGTFGQGVELASTAVQAIWDALTSALTTAGSIGKRIVDYLTGDIYARLGAPAGASTAADIASIKTDTGTTIPGRLPAALVSGRMDASVGAYQSGQAPLQPTTAGRTLDVSATGEAGIDWANVGSPTTTVGLSGTTIKTATDVETDTADIQTRLPATLTAGGNIKADALALSGDTVAADNLEAMLDGTGGTTLTTGITGNITGNLSGSVGSVTGAVGSVTGAVGSVTAGVTVTTNNDKTGYSLSDPAGLKANTAFSNFEFLMVDSSDHVSPKTGLTVTATRSIDGGAFASCANSASEVGSGVYKINLAAADLNGTCITFKFTATGADQTTVTVVTEP